MTQTRAIVAALPLLALALALEGCYEGRDPGFEGPGANDDPTSAPDHSDPAGGGGEVEAQCGPSSRVAAQPLRRLTHAQYDHAVRDLLGIEIDPASVFPDDEKAGAFASNGVTPISELQVEQLMDVAESLAATATQDMEALLPCQPDTVGEDACAQTFIDAFGRRAHRRPLDDHEVEMYWELFVQGRELEGFDNGIRLVVQAMLQSPYFVYHVELGEPSASSELRAPLTPHELASRLSFFLWDTIPDPTLMEAAEASELQTLEQIRAQVERMLDDPRAREAIASFHLQWLGVQDLERVDKDPDLFPGYDDALKKAMVAETADFSNWVTLEGDGRLETLLTSSSSVIDGPLFELYGVERPEGHVAGDPVELDPSERAGLLTHASLLTMHAHTDQTSPVHRGVIVRENFLCQPLALPPEDVDIEPPDPDPEATTRERFDQHTKDETCAACHSLIDPIGFGFEHYDAIGAYRSTEGDLEVDASGVVTSAADADGTFDGAIELAEQLAASETVSRCVSRQWLTFALGRIYAPDDACSSDIIYESFASSGFDIRELIVAVASSDSFRFLKPAEP